MRFAASEPAVNKALQELGSLGGFGLFGVAPFLSALMAVATIPTTLWESAQLLMH